MSFRSLTFKLALICTNTANLGFRLEMRLARNILPSLASSLSIVVLFTCDLVVTL